MTVALLILALAVAATKPVVANAETHADFDAVKRALRAASDEPLVRVEVSAVPESADFFVAICDTEDHWWGDVRCVKMSAGKLEWQAGWDGDEQSVLAARAFRDPRFKGPLIEVFGTTHMGHGNYYLYELQDKSLHRLLSTFAVDNHDDGTLILGHHLAVKYRDVNGDGDADIELSGKVELSSEDPRDRKIVPYRKTFLWEGNKRQFVFDSKRSETPAVYDWRE